MYCDYFGFTERPFHLTPNPRFLFLSKSHKEAFAHLLYGIDQQVGFICLTGEVGTGKTTVLRTLFEQLGDDPYRLALIFNPKISAVELLQAICAEFGVHSEQSDLISLHDAFNAFLLSERQNGKTVVLVVDEAQNLAPDVLEQIRLLSNLETETDKLLQIVLVGQPELAASLAKPELRQLSQRIVVQSSLVPLDRIDTAGYVKHRLQIAGWQAGPLFDRGALTKIFQISGGLPRKINVLSDRALLIAYGDEKRSIDVHTVRQAACELGMNVRKLPSYSHGLVVCSLLLVIVVGLFFIISPSFRGIEPHEIASIDSLHRQPVENSEQHLIRAVLTRWGGLDTAASPAVSPDDSADLSFDTLGELGYEVISSVQSMESLIRLGYPAVVKIVDPVTEKETTFSLLRRVGDQFEVALSDGNIHLASSVDVLLSRVISIQIPWKNREKLPLYISRKSESKKIAKLQHLLTLALGASLYRTGEYDEETMRMVRDVQRQGGISIDGEVGPQTLLLLYRMTDASVPQLESNR